MFIGGGSAGTAGGIKVTTFLLLAFVIWAEVRGEPDVVIAHAADRRVDPAAGADRGAARRRRWSPSARSPCWRSPTSPSTRCCSRSISAFATVGLSTGITADLPPSAQMVLVVLMFVGRVGTITVASALALRTAPGATATRGAAHRWLARASPPVPWWSSVSAGSAAVAGASSGSATRCSASTRTPSWSTGGPTGSPRSSRPTPPTRRRCASSASRSSRAPSSASAPTWRPAC